MNRLQGLLRNKKAMLGVAAAGGLGLVVALRKKGPAASGSGSDAATTAGTSSGGLATYDSTGSDVANQLGQFGNSINNSLSSFQQSLTDTLDALQNVPNGKSNAPGGLTAHQLHVLHQQHVANKAVKVTLPKKPSNGATPMPLSAHQLHVLHQQHVATTTRK